MKYLDKRFLRDFVRISIPLVITQLLSSLVGTADTVMLGVLNEKAISGVAVANRLFFVYSLTLFGLTNGVGVYIAQYYGAKDEKKYNQTLQYGILLCILLSFVGILIVFFFSNQMIGIFVKNSITTEYALQYLSFIKWSFIPAAISQMCRVIYTVTGQTKIPMISGFTAFITNVILNYLLIFGNFGFPEFGIVGAAIATLTARCFEAFIFMYMVYKDSYQLVNSNKLSPLNKKTRWAIMKTSIPLIINELIWSIGLSAVFMNYSYVGEKYLPALTVTENISDIVFVASSGCAAVAGVLVGGQLGVGKIEEAKNNSKKIIRISLIIYLCGSFLIIITSKLSPILFSLTDELLSISTRLLIIKGLTSWTQGYSNTIYYILRSGGDTKSVLAIDGIFTFFGPVLMSFIFSRVIKSDLWVLYLIIESMGYIKMFVATNFYKKEGWLKVLT